MTDFSTSNKLPLNKNWKNAEKLQETNKELLDLLDENSLETLCDIFAKEKGKGLDAKTLKFVLEDLSQQILPDEEYSVTFLKINSKRYF